VILVALVAIALTACGSNGNGRGRASDPTRATAATTPPTTAASTTTRPPAPPAPTVPPPTGAVQPIGGYAGTYAPVRAAELSASWHAGCPVAPDRLRLLSLPYIGFDGAPHTGHMVVHADVAVPVIGVFQKLYAARFPIRRMVLIDAYGGRDDASVYADNTSAFNCRAVTGGSSWSEHAYGKAIDIDPLENPYVYRDGHVMDAHAAPFTHRDTTARGVIHASDVVTNAFAAIGWRWGGNFTATKDYQHFSANGR
jgi:D-alanyl-D-alanine carboxypeptidase-like protein